MSPAGGDGGARVPRWAAALAVGSLLLLALLFWKGAIGPLPPKDSVPPSDPAHADTATVRAVRREMTFDGAPCQSCHDGAEPLQGHPNKKGVFHEGIELKHGRNQHCFNCHHRLQPADFSNFDGSRIALKSVEILCAKCHGTTYRDWQQGAHGRRSGTWDGSKGGYKTLVCIACHDPHWPVFKPIEAAPPPRVNPRGRGARGHGEGGH